MGLISRVSSRTYRKNISLPEELKDVCSNLTETLNLIETFYDDKGNLRENYSELLKTITDPIKYSSINSLINSQTQATSMYTVNTLLWILMKLNNIEPATHVQDRTSVEQEGTLMSEIKIVQQVLGRVTEGEQLLKTMRVDKAAVKRILKHNLPDEKDQEEQLDE